MDPILESEEAFKLAQRVLDKPSIDPDGDICLLARQYLRSRERIADLMAELDLLRKGAITPELCDCELSHNGLGLADR